MTEKITLNDFVPHPEQILRPVRKISKCMTEQI